MPRARTESQILQVSLGALWTLGATQGRATAAELAAGGGVSVRTFHRMFPRKEDCIRPATADARDVMCEVIAAQPIGIAPHDAYLRGFAAAAGGAYAERTRLLLPVIAADPHFAAVWEHEARLGIASIAAALRPHVQDLYEAETLATAYVALTQRAMEDATHSPSDSITHLERRLASMRDAVTGTQKKEGTS